MQIKLLFSTGHCPSHKYYCILPPRTKKKNLPVYTNFAIWACSFQKSSGLTRCKQNVLPKLWHSIKTTHRGPQQSISATREQAPDLANLIVALAIQTSTQFRVFAAVLCKADIVQALKSSGVYYLLEHLWGLQLLLHSHGEYLYQSVLEASLPQLWKHVLGVKDNQPRGRHFIPKADTCTGTPEPRAQRLLQQTVLISTKTREF